MILRRVGLVFVLLMTWSILDPQARGQCSFVQQQQIVASDGANGDQFTHSIAISGDRMIIGADLDDTAAGNDAGSAYMFRFTCDSWVEEQHLVAPDGATGDKFGTSVAISGGVALVGARLGDSPQGENTGCAYVYRWNGGAWAFEQKLFASDGTANDWFGFALGISSDHAIIGAQMGDAAYAFAWSGAVWSQNQILLPLDSLPGNRFGYAVSIADDRAVISAPGSGAGAAYVFHRSGSWAQEEKLTASDGSTGDYFGESVAIAMDRVIVGAQLDRDESNIDAGSAYIFRRSGSAWSQDQRLAALDGQAADRFGVSAAISGERIVIGAYLDDTGSGAGAGSAYTFRWNGSSWSQEAQLQTIGGSSDDQFGFAVAMHGDRVVVGAVWDDTSGGGNAGSAYTFRPTLLGDADSSGTVNFTDITAVLGNFNATCP